MKQRFGYLVDLSQVQLDENGNVSWIQAFPLGKWKHPVYGDIEMTSAKAEKIAANVQANVRGQELNIDYDHQPGEAAGWVKNAEARADGLWLAVEWTKEAAEKIKNKVYRYFSPEYVDEWEDPRNQAKHTDVLFGGGITNRPFLKGILPLNLSEAFVTQTHNEVENGDSVDPKLLRQALKLDEKATDDEVTAALKKLTEPANNPDPQAEADKKKLEEQQLADKAKLLAETDPIVKALNDRIAILEGSTRLGEVELALKSLDEAGDKVTLAPAVIEQAKAIALNAPRAVGDKVLALLKEVKKNGVVPLTEDGRTTSESDDKTATQEYMEKASKYAKDNEVPLADAMSVISMSEPALFEAYRSESYLRERG